MSRCPACKTPGAYIGFTTVECQNPECKHFVPIEKRICPCCGIVGHVPDAGTSQDTLDTTPQGTVDDADSSSEETACP
ncbi:MAG TPA: hypothetical protein VGP72_30035 [Planctomycetota bacterium]|jgi:hypothetical protein